MIDVSKPPGARSAGEPQCPYPAPRSKEHPGHFEPWVDLIDITWAGGARSTQEYFLAKYGRFALNGVIHDQVLTP